MCPLTRPRSAMIQVPRRISPEQGPRPGRRGPRPPAETSGPPCTHKYPVTGVICTAKSKPSVGDIEALLRLEYDGGYRRSQPGSRVPPGAGWSVPWETVARL